MKIITNKKPRQAVYYPACSKAECKAIESAYSGLIELDGAEFVFYKNHPYFMGDCMRLRQGASVNLFGDYWDGSFDDTFFSRVLVHVTDDGDYIFGMAYS